MNIGEAAKASQISAKMIRYYEQIGVIAPPERSASGYRAYTEKDVHRLQFIRRARDLGFSVAEIGDLLGLWGDQSRRSADVKQLAQQHLAELDQRMEDMRQMRETLQGLITCCAGDDRPDCPILSGIEHTDMGAPAPGKRPGAVARGHRDNVTKTQRARART